MGSPDRTETSFFPRLSVYLSWQGLWSACLFSGSEKDARSAIFLLAEFTPGLQGVSSLIPARLIGIARPGRDVE